ncbi:MAG TPA: hypothetical protein VIO94_16060 [Phenylobacterium sp.]
MTDDSFHGVMAGLGEALRHASGEEVPGVTQWGGVRDPDGHAVRYKIAGDFITIGDARPVRVSELRRALHLAYDIPKPKDGWKTEFTDDEKCALRPVAETLAMLDGNAFFGADLGDGRDWYEQYLPEAHELWVSNGRPPLGATK